MRLGRKWVFAIKRIPGNEIEHVLLVPSPHNHTVSSCPRLRLRAVRYLGIGGRSRGVRCWCLVYVLWRSSRIRALFPSLSSFSIDTQSFQLQDSNSHSFPFGSHLANCELCSAITLITHILVYQTTLANLEGLSFITNIH